MCLVHVHQEQIVYITQLFARWNVVADVEVGTEVGADIFELLPKLLTIDLRLGLIHLGKHFFLDGNGLEDVIFKSPDNLTVGFNKESVAGIAVHCLVISNNGAGLKDNNSPLYRRTGDDVDGIRV